MSLVYAVIIGVRNLLYDWRILKSTSFDKVKTICVGNLSVGGTGKTPHIEYLVKLLENEFKLATLSRGYKRKTSGFLLADSNSTAEDIGDEPLQFKSKNPSLKVAVDANRVHGIETLLKENDPPEVVLLDDAFQHRSVKAGLNILLTDYNNLFLNDTYLPAGRLRESKKNCLRADIIVVTKTPDKATSVDIRGIIKDMNIRAYQAIFFSYLKYGNLYGFSDPSKIVKPAMELFRYNVMAFTGIANDKPMITFIKEYAEDIVHKKYGDHHEYSTADIDDIIKIFNNIAGENKIIVTTEKDAMRLQRHDLKNALEGLPLYILPVEVDFRNKAEEFNENVLKYVRANKIYHKKYM